MNKNMDYASIPFTTTAAAATSASSFFSVRIVPLQPTLLNLAFRYVSQHQEADSYLEAPHFGGCWLKYRWRWVS